MRIILLCILAIVAFICKSNLTCPVDNANSQMAPQQNIKQHAPEVVNVTNYINPTPNLSAYFYYNPFLNFSISPSYYPTTISPNRINIVAPSSIDLSKITFPNISINPANLKTPFQLELSSYQSYINTTQSTFEVIQANHNYIVGKIENDILTGKISNGCTNVARISVEAAKKWLPSYCPIAETPPTLLACAIGVALQNSIARKATTKIVKEGCKVTVRYVNDKVIELSFETSKELKRSTEEAKFFLSFLNSVDGMIWIMNRLQRNN